MPDQWGRTNFQDGAQIYTGLKMIERDNLERQDREDETKIQEAAYRAEQGEDISDVPTPIRMPAEYLVWDRSNKRDFAKMGEYRLSEAGRQEKISEIQLEATKNQADYKKFEALANIGDEAGAKKIAKQIYNNSFNGYNVQELPDGQTERTSLMTGQKEILPEMGIPEIRDILAQFVGYSDEEVVNIGLSASELRAKKNLDHNLKNGKLWSSPGKPSIIFVPPGNIDPITGKLMEGYFTTITGNRKISEKEVQRLGYRSSEDVKESMGLQLTQARINQVNSRETGGGGEPKLDLFSKERIKDVSGTISEIDKVLVKGTKADQDGDEVPLTDQDKFSLEIQKRQLENQAREMQGQESGGIYRSPEEVGHAINYGLVSKEEGKNYIKQHWPTPGADSGSKKGSDLNTGKDNLGKGVSLAKKETDTGLDTEPDSVDEPEKPKGLDLRNPISKIIGDKPLYEITPEDYTDVRVDKSGAVWGKSKNGAAVRIARKPPETVRDNTGKKIPSPEYQQYIELLQRFGLK